MSSQEIKEDTKEEPTLIEGFQINILDLIYLYKYLAERINKLGLESPCSPGIFEAAHTYIKSRNSVELITNFIDKSWENWKLCPTKDEPTLFKNIKVLFPGIPDAILGSIPSMFEVKHNGKKVITEKDKESIWEYVTELIRMAILYLHEERCWGLKPDGKFGYTKVFFKPISVSEYAALFKVSITKQTN